MENHELTTPSQPLDMLEQLETILPDEYANAYGEELSKTLNLDTWHTNDDLTGFYAQLEEEIREAVRCEDKMRARIRKIIFPNYAIEMEHRRTRAFTRVRWSKLSECIADIFSMEA